MYKDIIILTKSSKNGKYCVAGIDFNTGKWIRLVSDDTDSDGALSECDMRINDGYCKPLDLVRVEIEKAVPTGCQIENHLVVSGKRWLKLDTLSLDEVLKIHKPKSSYNIFGNSMPYISGIDRMSHSLFLAEVTDLKVYHFNDGRERTRADFIFKRQEYKDIRVTDPEYYKLPDHNVKKAYIVFSIPNRATNDKYYKFIAKIFPVEKYFDFEISHSIREIVDAFELPISIRKYGWTTDYYFTIKQILENKISGTYYKNDKFYAFDTYQMDDYGFYVCQEKNELKYKRLYSSQIYENERKIEIEYNSYTQEDLDVFYDKLYKIDKIDKTENSDSKSKKNDLENFNAFLNLQRDVQKAAEEKRKNDSSSEITTSKTQLELDLKLKPNESSVYIFEEGIWKTVKYIRFENQGCQSKMYVEGGIFPSYDYPNSIVALTEDQKKTQEKNAAFLDRLNSETIMNYKKKHEK